MGTQAKARDIRRETKRTLGAQLQAFGANQLTRLQDVERRHAALDEVLNVLIEARRQEALAARVEALEATERQRWIVRFTTWWHA